MASINTTTRPMLCDNLARDERGELCFAGVPLSTLAAQYGTPLYLYDEERIRERCRTYRAAIKATFGEGGEVLYASKAASFRRLYEIMREEDMGIDVVSSGEIFTARAAGFPMERAYFHSNNKTDADIRYAMESGVGYLVVDNEEELYAIERIGEACGVRQRILLRLTPGIDPHTYAAVATGKVDSKFGSAIETGQAEAITALSLTLPHVQLCGFHCHVGSQVFDADIFLRTAEVMLSFIAHIEKTHGFLAPRLDLGGGFGVRYTEEQPTVDIAACIGELGTFMKRRAEELGIPLPTVLLEPGRSIVADAGLTVYTVGTVKHIPGYKTYVSVDGGMTDNPRFALYGSPYTILPVMGEVGEEATLCSVVGRCCESGDILQERVPLPPMRRGDLLACLTTGAYHYSMASNYNRIPRPPVVMIADKTPYIAVRRETVEDLVRLEM